MKFGDLITSTYNSFLVGSLEQAKGNDRRVLRVFDSKDGDYIESYLDAKARETAIKEERVSESAKHEFGELDQLEDEFKRLTNEAVALTCVPRQASIINIIKCFLQASSKCKKAVLLISPPSATEETSFVVLCILSKEVDAGLFLNDLSAKAAGIFEVAH